MKKMLQAVAVSAAMLLTMAGASATTITLTGSGNDYTGGFNVTHSAMGTFTDTFTFTPVFSESMVSSVLSSIGFKNSQILSFDWVKLNGQMLTLDTSGTSVILAYTPQEFSLTGPITLEIQGHSGGNASYSGVINLTVVPEPEGYALMLAGLGVVGYIGRRKKRQAEMAA